MTQDSLIALFWFIFVVGSFLVSALQKTKASSLLAMAIMVMPAFYLTLLFIFRFDVRATLDFARLHRVVLFLYPIQIVILSWSIFLSIRIALLKPGSTIDWFGRSGPPDAETIEEALAIMGRAERHDLLNEVSYKWLREDVELRKAAKMAADRPPPLRPAYILDKILKRKLYKRIAAWWAYRQVHPEQELPAPPVTIEELEAPPKRRAG